MGIITADLNKVKNCVNGGQGCLRKTLESSMNRRAQAPAASGFVMILPFFWMALLAVAGVFILSSAPLRAETAGANYKHGERAEAREEYDAAFNFYQKACAKDPKDLVYRTALYRVRVTTSAIHLTKGRKLFDAGDNLGALTEYIHAAEIDPGNEAAQQEIARVRQKMGEMVPTAETGISETAGNQSEIDSMGAPVVLKPLSNEPLTLHMAEDTKVVYQAVGKAAGVNILFDPEFTAKRIQVDLNGVSLSDALRILGTLSGTFWRPVTSNTIFVAANTRAKRTELDEQAVETFYLTNAWQQNDLNDVQTALRNVLGTNVKVYGVASQNAIVARGTPDELLLAQKLINDLDKPRAEVVVDISVLEVSKNWERNLGIAWPSSVSVALQGTSTTTTSSGTSSSSSTSTPTLYELSHLKASNFAVTVNGATLNLMLSDANTKILDNPRIRCTDGQKATMKIGEKIPTATGSYSTGTTASSVSGLVNTQFQYQDVGVNIEMTPTIHYDHDVTLKIKLEDSSEGTPVVISGISEPVIIQKTSEQVIRLREGEASIMSGMVSKTDTATWTGVPGLGSIPGLKYLFGSKDHTITDDEIVFVVVPHIVRTQSIDQTNLRAIDTGSGQSIDLRHLPSVNAPASPTTAPLPVRPAPAAPSSSVAPIPTQTAVAAGPAALAQMRNAADTNGNVVATAAVNQPLPPPVVPAKAAVPAAAALTPAVSPGVSFMLNAPQAPVANGATFQVPVVLMGGKDIASVPLQLQFDPTKLALVNVSSGDFLSQDGKAATLIHRDDGAGLITINASRPPGSAGVNGAGVVCVLSFQAKAVGGSSVTITRPAAINSAQQQVPAKGSQISVLVK